MPIEDASGNVVSPAAESPSAEPAAGSSTPVESSASDSSFALTDEQMFGDHDDDLIELPAETADKPTETPQEPAGATPSAQVAPTKPAVAETKAGGTAASPPTPQQPAASPPATQQPAVSPQPLTGADLAQQLTANRDVLIDNLASTRFALTPKEVEAIEVDAVAAIPKLLARVFYDSAINSLMQINNMVPRMVSHVAQEQIQTKSAEDAFFQAWPGLDRSNPEHVRTLNTVVQAFRASNPKASQEDAIKFVGTAASAFLGLQPPAAAPAGGANGRTPSAPNGRSPVVRQTPRTFVPASGGAPAAQPPGTPNPFAGMGLSFDD